MTDILDLPDWRVLTSNDGMDPDTLLLPCPYCDGTGGELLGHDDYDDEDAGSWEDA